jgi:hypothetical protein
MRSVNILAFAGIVAALCVPGPSKHKTTLSLQLEEDKPNPAMLSTHKPEETKKLLPFLQPGGRIETDTNWGSLEARYATKRYCLSFKQKDPMIQTSEYKTAEDCFKAHEPDPNRLA